MLECLHRISYSEISTETALQPSALKISHNAIPLLPASGVNDLRRSVWSFKYVMPISSTACVNTTVHLGTFCSRFEYQLSEVMVVILWMIIYYFAKHTIIFGTRTTYEMIDIWGRSVYGCFKYSLPNFFYCLYQHTKHLGVDHRSTIYVLRFFWIFIF